MSLLRKDLKDGQCFVYCYQDGQSCGIPREWEGGKRYVISYEEHCKTPKNDDEQYERSITNSGWSPGQTVRLIPHWLEPDLKFSDLVAGDCFTYVGYNMNHILVNAGGEDNPSTEFKPDGWAVSYKYTGRDVRDVDNPRVIRIPHWNQGRLIIPSKVKVTMDMGFVHAPHIPESVTETMKAPKWGSSPLTDPLYRFAKLMFKYKNGNYIDGLSQDICLERFTLNMRDGYKLELTTDQQTVAGWMWQDKLKELNKKSEDKDRMQVVVDLDWE